MTPSPPPPPALKNPDILCAIFDTDIEKRFSILASCCCVDRFWCDLARDRLYAKTDLSIVLRRLPHDVWYIYDEQGDRRDLYPTAYDLDRHRLPTRYARLEQPTLTLRRAITQDEWSSLLHITSRVREIEALSDYAYTEENQGVYDVSQWDNLALNLPAVYRVLARCLPKFCLFPRLRTLHVLSFGGVPGVLRLFDSPELRTAHLSAEMHDFDAAACITALVDETTGLCPIQRMTLNYKYDSLYMGTLALAKKLQAFTALRKLEVDYIDPLLWPSVALLPSLQELVIRWMPAVTFARIYRESDLPEFEDYEGANERSDALVLPSRHEIRGTAFPALKTLGFLPNEDCSLTGVQLRTILEMRDAPWALEELDIPFRMLDLNYTHSARTIFRYLRDHIRADTLTHLTLSTVREWRRASMGYNPLSGVFELFGFSQLTVLRLYCFFDEPQSMEPLDAALTHDIARSFPRLRELQLAMPFPAGEIGVFAQHCPELHTLALCPCQIDPDTDLSELLWRGAAPTQTGFALQRFGICTEQLFRPKKNWAYLLAYAHRLYPNATIREQSLLVPAMSTARVLTVPELLSIVLDFVVEDGYDDGIRSACYVAKSWRVIAEEHLWAHVDLSIVLRKLPLDAWYIYDTLRRGITQAEWVAVLPKTGRVRTMQTVGGPSDPEELLSEWGGLALAPAVYDMLAASMPNLCLFPRLHSLRVPAFGDQPGVLRLFASPGLRSVYFDERLDADFAAPYIAAFIDPATGVCPLQEMTLNHEYGSSETDLAVLAVSLSACTALRRLTIEYLDPELWPSVALLPSLEELTLRWAPQVTFGNDPLTENGFYDFEDFEEEDPYDDAEDLPSRDQIQGIAFPALRSLTLPNKEWGSLTLTQFRTVWEMREEPWALEKLVIPRDTLHLHLKYSVRTILRYIKEHIRADTLTHLVVSTLWEWRHGIPGDYNPLSAISELFGFSRLTHHGHALL
ncbi:hypothetical protein K525DRAFT_208446 [Schizophyllum commune Loenen D]|nr:hypothetical protein K525DRAFT_208446 [Schizophyllum commune Loenen D]